MSKTKIYIDPTSRLLYASYYIDGLCQVFGKQNVSYNSCYFQDLERKTEYAYQHYFAFVSINKHTTTKYVVDFCDALDTNATAYNWCDVYAKINCTAELLQQPQTPKIILIPPAFGIQIYNLPQTFFYGLQNIYKSGRRLPVSKTQFLRDYYHQYKRAKLQSYLQTKEKYRPKNRFVFLIATLWGNEDFSQQTNQIRKQFITACKNQNCNFEGRFFAKTNHPNYLEYQEFIFTKPYTISEYIIKTKQSVFVFNTPAVHNCHGWKLAEFLAMGKAILSVSLSNVLSQKLLHGQDIHLISDTSELNFAIDLLLSDKKYQTKLAQNAKKYFLKNCLPDFVIKSFVT